MKIKIDYMKRFYSTNKTFQYHLHRNPNPPPPTPPPKKKKWKYPFISKLQEIVSKNVQNMKPVHIAQVSFHILHIFAQVLYFAHFSRLNIFSKGLLVKTFYKI